MYDVFLSIATRKKWFCWEI